MELLRYASGAVGGWFLMFRYDIGGDMFAPGGSANGKATLHDWVGLLLPYGLVAFALYDSPNVSYSLASVAVGAAAAKLP